MPKPAFTKAYYANLGKLYEPSVRPTGVVNLAVAENKLAAPLMMQRLQTAGDGISAESLAYNPYVGSERLRRAVARVVSRHIAQSCNVEAEQVLLTNGAGSALWLLSALIANPGQSILVPSPYYYAYDRDLCGLNGSQLVIVEDSEGRDPLSHEALTEAARGAAAAGTPCRLLVITNPSNPTGEVLSAERLLNAIEWAEAHGVDVIVNELYACSVLQGDFISVLRLYSGPSGECRLPKNVHFVWGLSKDFAANGLRCACIYSGSAEVVDAASTFCYFFQVGGPVQVQLSECLEDDDWVDGFLSQSREMVRKSVEVTEGVLQRLEVPYLAPQGALFVWADLQKWIVRAGGELELFKHLSSLDKGGVLLCPGSSFRASAGWFRICVTAAPKGHLAVGLDRLERGLSQLASE